MSIASTANTNQRDRDYETLLDAIPDLMLRLDRDGVCLEFRQARNFRSFGAGLNWQGKHLCEFVPPELAKQRMEYVERAIATGEIQVYDQQIEVDGQLQYEEVRVIRCNDYEALVIVRDLSDRVRIEADRKQAEQALRQSEARFQRLAANIPGTIYQFRLDPSGTASFPYVSAFSQELWEVEPALICQNAALILDQLYPDDRLLFEASVQQSAVALAPWHWTGRITTPSGKLKWIQAHARPELQPDGAIVWDGLIMDVSDRVRADEERKRAEAAISESEARFQQFVENANDLIFAVSSTSAFTYASPKLIEITGFLPSEIIGKSFIDYVHPDDLALIIASTQSVFATGSKQTEVEFRGLRKDGTWCWLTCNSAPIQAADGTVTSVLGIARDISDRKAQEAALKQSEAQLRQRSIELETTLQELRRTQAQLIHSEKMSSLGQLVAGIAHEINNPISFIHGNIDHARDYVCDLATLIVLYQKYYSPPVQEIQDYVEKIELNFIRDDLFDLFASMQTGTERIRQIVLSLRTFSRLDEAEIKAIDLHESLESTLTILQHRLHQLDRWIKVIRRYGEIPPVECYASEINQVFLHLLNNAVDALETQSSPKIVIYTEQLDAEWIRIRIVDNGCGIAEAVQARMFDPFFTTKLIGKGCGMGLSVSYQIVTEQHNGVLACVSAPNRGAEFRIDLPICQSCDQVGKLRTAIDGSHDESSVRSFLQ